MTCKQTVYTFTKFLNYFLQLSTITSGYVVVQLVGTLRYKPEGRWFNSQWCYSGHIMALSLTQPLTEMSTRNISWDKGGRCVGLTTLLPSFADSLEIWEPQPPGNLGACPGM